MAGDAFDLDDFSNLPARKLRRVEHVFVHRTACLAFAIQESAHINVWKNHLEDLGLPVGP